MPNPYNTHKKNVACVLHELFGSTLPLTVTECYVLMKIHNLKRIISLLIGETEEATPMHCNGGNWILYNIAGFPRIHQNKGDDYPNVFRIVQ